MIKANFFSEFHPMLGPKISYQVPEDYVSKEIFDAVSVYIIPKEQLDSCIITVNVLGHKITGYPVRISDEKYPRNFLIFNLCFVCDSHVLPYIDGRIHVARVAIEADVDIGLVKACIQNLLYYGVVQLIPIFQYTQTPRTAHEFRFE